MSIVEFNGGPVTHRYLMNKTKSELASMYMDLLRIRERIERERNELRNTLVDAGEEECPKCASLAIRTEPNGDYGWLQSCRLCSYQWDSTGPGNEAP